MTAKFNLNIFYFNKKKYGLDKITTNLGGLVQLQNPHLGSKFCIDRLSDSSKFYAVLASYKTTGKNSPDRKN